MKVETTRFGMVEVADEELIDFLVGPYGFEEKNEFVLLADNDTAFFWLQSVSDPDLAFVVSEPWVFCSNYEFNLSDEIKNKLELETKEDILVVNMIVIPDDPKNITMNLRSPVIINKNKQLAKQIILEDEDYPIKYQLFNEQSEEVSA